MCTAPLRNVKPYPVYTVEMLSVSLYSYFIKAQVELSVTLVYKKAHITVVFFGIAR